MPTPNTKPKGAGKYYIASLLLLIATTVFSQPKQISKPPTQSEMNKMIEAEMKGMSEKDKAEIRNMMKEVMPALQENNNRMADYPAFTLNRQLLPEKDHAKIAAIPTKKLIQADISAYASRLFNSIISKGKATEVALAKKIIAQNPKANAIGGAAVLCMLQGHPEAAMALSMKAVMADPLNSNCQNNMASLLTLYGYPEQAIPLLQKLKNQFPQNSTVLNNLGQAWFALGETDSAAANINRAGGLNPYYPEAKETEGVIEETSGNTEKATEDYVKAMENAVNPFTETLIKNNNGQSKLDKLDFDKLKRAITIYEYFPKNWIKIPRLSDDVAGYENDMAIKNGYAKMFDSLKSNLNILTEASSAEIEALAEKGDKAFVKTMAKENLKGLSFMSKPALIVQILLQAHLRNWMEEYVKEASDLKERLNSERVVMTKTGADDKCPDFDRKNNAFLQYANPLIRNFHAEKIEAFRAWLNAFCTWSWYITGNPKNTILTACISWTGAITELYESAIHDQYTFARSCVKNNGDGVSDVEVPDIPNFTCPAVVHIPIGADWLQLSNSAKNFDNNNSGTKKNSSNPVPNHSIAFTADHNSIAQPGTDPFTKSANGSMSPGMINDEGLTPLSKIPLDDLTPLPKLPPDDLTPLPDLNKSKLAKELLKKMMTADCKNIRNSKDILKDAIDKMMKSVRALEAYENVIGEIEKLEAAIEQKEADAAKKALLNKQIEKMQQETDKMDKYEEVGESKKEMEKLMKEMEAMDDKKMLTEKFDKIRQLVDEMEATPAVLKGIQQNGLQTTISCGLQAPGTFTPLSGLFN